jgi:hypothetical protein
LRAAMGQASRRIVEKFSCDNFARNALRSAQVAMGDNPSPLTDSTVGKGSTGLDSNFAP